MSDEHDEVNAKILEFIQSVERTIVILDRMIAERKQTQGVLTTTVGSGTLTTG